MRTSDAELQASAWWVTMDARMVGWFSSVHRHFPSPSRTRRPTASLSTSATNPRPPRPLPTRTSHLPGVWLVSGAARSPRPAALCGQRSRAWQGRAPWSVDGQGQIRVARGQAGGSGGAQSASLCYAWKVAPARTSINACTLYLMRFHPVWGASAPSNHVVHGQRRHPQLLLLAAACVTATDSAIPTD